MNSKNNIDWQNLAAKLFCVIIIIFAVVFFGKYLLVAVLPFLIAWATALLVRPVAKFFSKKIGLSQKFCATVLLILFFVLIGLFLVFTVNRLLSESGKLLERLSSESDKIGTYLSDLTERINNLRNKIPILRELRKLEGLEALDNYVNVILQEIGKGITSAITTKIPELLGAFISSLPSFFLFFLISLMASFYFTLDLDTIQNFFILFLPQNLVNRIPAFQKSFKNFLSRYFRAYALILFLTFCELYVGFSILSLEYSFLPAVLIALVDIFPVFGVGTVLIPWAGIMLLRGNYYIGFGLLILWAVIAVVRQIIEPRIVGGTLGVHPALMLIAMYIGFRFFGILGILLSPAVLTLTRFAVKELKKQKNEQTYL